MPLPPRNGLRRDRDAPPRQLPSELRDLLRLPELPPVYVDPLDPTLIVGSSNSGMAGRLRDPAVQPMHGVVPRQDAPFVLAPLGGEK